MLIVSRTKLPIGLQNSQDLFFCQGWFFLVIAGDGMSLPIEAVYVQLLHGFIVVMRQTRQFTAFGHLQILNDESVHPPG